MLGSKLFIFSSNIDGFYRFSHGSLATPLRYAGIFSNHLITNFPQNVPVKNFDNRSTFGEDMDKSLRRTFWATM